MNLEWCESRIRARFGDRATITAVERLASRLAEVYRLDVGQGSDKWHCYLKDCTGVSLQMPVSEYVSCVLTLDTAYEGQKDLLASGVLAFHPERRLLLTKEVPGRPLTALHRMIVLNPSVRATGIVAWRGVGRWLARLHWNAQPATLSDTRTAELKAFTIDRLQKWAVTDPSCSELAQRAIRATCLASSQLRDRPVTVTLCHGDVSAGNIMVNGSSVGLIDLDDVRFDLPSLDLSLAVLEIAEFSRVAPVFWLKRFAADARRALEAGYGRPFPKGSEFWLPHLRNVAVLLLTLANRRTHHWVARVSNGRRYRRTCAELARTVSADTAAHSTLAPPNDE